MKNGILLFVSFLIYVDAFSQTKEIRGTIYAFNTYPLKNVIVKSKKTKSEVLTDDRGMFSIQVKKNDLLTFNAEGFERYSYRVKEDDRSLRINLLYEDGKRNKGLAIDNDYLSREDLEYGIEHLASENSIFDNFTNVFDAVKYALPAANFFIENGETKIMLRGPKTMAGSNAALTIVDGVIVDDISYISPSEILRIEQLSGSRSAIYGARAGNGVVSITTK